MYNSVLHAHIHALLEMAYNSVLRKCQTGNEHLFFHCLHIGRVSRLGLVTVLASACACIMDVAVVCCILRKQNLHKLVD